MRHSAILSAALAAGGMLTQTAIMLQLFDYARQRKFPPPETLARKASEIAGVDFPFKSLTEAPEPTRVFFTAFRAVAEALEPFYEPDPVGHDEGQGIEAAAADTPAGGEPELVEVEIVFEPYDDKKAYTPAALVFLDAQPRDGSGRMVGTWTADGEYEALLLTVHRSDIRDRPAHGGDFDNSKEHEVTDDKKEPADDDHVDEVETKRRIAQAETDKVIAESGGQFSKPAPKKKHK